MYKILLLVCLLFVFGNPPSNKKQILIIGDSISIGYTPFVKESLKDVAKVQHNKGNAGNTAMGIENLGHWIGNTNWDIIQFNFGLWDLCYRHPNAKVYGNRDKINGTITFTLEEYEKNLREVVALLKQSNARLIFVTTTYVPDGEAGRFKGDELKYNKAALKVMNDHGIAVNDIHEVSEQIHHKHKTKAGDVHFTETGYKLLATEITRFLKNSIEHYE